MRERSSLVSESCSKLTSRAVGHFKKKKMTKSWCCQFLYLILMGYSRDADILYG